MCTRPFLLLSKGLGTRLIIAMLVYTEHNRDGALYRDPSLSILDLD